LTNGWALSEAAAAGLTFPPVIAGLGVGGALGSTPGPVQAVLLAESVQGGIARGFRALAGANTAFGSLLVCLALGLSLAVPRGATLAALQVAGGALLLWLSIDAFRQLRKATGAGATAAGRVALPPYVRGALAVVLNPGGWLFLAAVASPLFASADQHNGTAGALAVVAAMIAGIAAGDTATVLAGALGIRRAGGRAGQWARCALAALLAGFGGWLLVTGVISLVTA
jgi:threonine/homoserine/homoserine lactone efflux protein